MTSRPASAAYYDRDAAGHARRYGSVRFEDVHAPIIAALPPPPGEVLDVGAGTGRDAAALADRGYRVTAVEPSRELQRLGREKYRLRPIEWMEDRLPTLGTLREAGRQFDFILCSAVLMHLAPPDLVESFMAFADLLRPGAHLVVSVRNKLMHDPSEIFFDHGEAAIAAAASLAGLRLASRQHGNDQLGRGEVSWRSYVFVK